MKLNEYAGKSSEFQMMRIPRRPALYKAEVSLLRLDQHPSLFTKSNNLAFHPHFYNHVQHPQDSDEGRPEAPIRTDRRGSAA